jgi:soluble epoxide hydrolase / lipid-phosphate phosphatase
MTGGEKASKADALVPDDPRVQHLNDAIGGYNYHYILANPETTPVATILLVHGWPDLGMGWRYQVPFLTKLGLRVIVPDLLGYGKTSAPDAVSEYSLKKMSGHLKALVEHIVGIGEKVILGGHDWGAALVWRMAMWHPEVVSAAFTLNVPYLPANAKFADLAAVAERIPSFRYQLQLASPVAETIVDASETNLRGFLAGIYGGKGPAGELAFTVDVGVREENLAKIGAPALMDTTMLDFYVREYQRHGLHGPTNWYRTRPFNFEDEKDTFASIEGGFKFRIPAMVVMGEKDPALPPHLADGMERWFDAGLKKEVAPGVGHWAMWQDPETINGYIGDFLAGVLGDKSKLKL